MKQEESGLSLESVAFIIRHPWLFISPIVIAMSIVFSFLASIPPDYECRAIVSFEAPAGQILNTKFVQTKQDLIDNLLIGENVRNIARLTWPDVDEKADPLKFNNLVERLRNPKSGIMISYSREKGKEQDFFGISFADSDPKTAFQVVQSAIDTLKTANKRKAEGDAESGLAFLKKQLEFYSGKLKSIDEDISKIRIELRKRYNELSDDEKYLLGEVLDTSTMNIKTQTKAQQLANYDQRLTELNLQLLELQRKKENIETRIAKGEVAPSLLTKDIEEDSFIKGYSSAVVTKELAMAELLSQGYMKEHPQVKKIEGEIENLKTLRQQRLAVLMGKGGTGDTKKLIEEGLKKELQDIDSEIETINIKIRVLESYKRSSEEQMKPAAAKTGAISEQTTKLRELTDEKELNQKYYQDVRQQLEVAEIKGRIEQAEAGMKINVVEEPRLPLKPVPFKKIKIIVLGLLISLTSGTGLAYLAYSLDTSIKSPSELRELLQVPVLGSIDRISTQQEMRLDQVRRNSIIIGLVAFAILSRLFVEIFLKLF